MSPLQHQRLAGIGLSVFALVEVGVLINAGFEARKLYLEMLERDPQTLFSVLMIFGVAFALSLILIQCFGALRMILSTHPVPAWGLAASIIAIATLWGLPVGIYGVWTQISLSNKKKEYN